MEIDHFDDACVAIGVGVLEAFTEEGIEEVLIVRDGEGGFIITGMLKNTE